MDLTALSEWYVTGKDLRKLIYEAGFNSPYSYSKYFDLNYSKVQRWLKLEMIPDGRVIAYGLLALKYKAQVERLERELAARDKAEGKG